MKNPTFLRTLQDITWRPHQSKFMVEQANVETALSAQFKISEKLLLRRQRLSSSFTPTRPLSGGSEFDEIQDDGPLIGREIERARIMRALIEDRSHVVIYGERGRGKTSLANLVVTQARAVGFDVVRYVCSADSQFDTIIRGLFQDIPRWPGGPSAGGVEEHSAAKRLLPTSTLRPNDVLALAEVVRGYRLVLVIDEFDRIIDQATRTAMADTIKQCSDCDMRLSFIIIGVSDSAEELLGRHPSIQRCVARVALPLLSNAQISRVIERGARRAGLCYSTLARTCIAELSRGVPYLAQLLALRAGQAALNAGRMSIQGDDLIAAIEAALAEADPRMMALYSAITKSEQDRAALNILRASAAGVQDEFGRFRVFRHGSGLHVAGVQADPAAWQRVLTSGVIRIARGADPGLYTFGVAMLPQVVLLRAALLSQAARERGSGSTQRSEPGLCARADGHGTSR